MKKLVILTIILINAYTVNAQSSIPKAQAMFIYNFCRLIEWPASYKSGPFVIGVIGESPTLNEINSFLSGKRIGNQTVLIKTYSTFDQIDQCHILFVPFSQTKNLTNITAKVGNNSTLIIGEKVESIEKGAAITFTVVANKLKYEVKPANAEKRDVQISSKIREMAFKVHE